MSTPYEAALALIANQAHESSEIAARYRMLGESAAAARAEAMSNALWTIRTECAPHTRLGARLASETEGELK